ncbi:TPA: DUF3491 domain-containing protein [Vibrio parahaemolyticus]|nr:DUF3491 domain-containing protein [Vibrio parahaemolyticus]
MKNLSTDDVVTIGGMLQEEIRKTINPTNSSPVNVSGNWKSVILHRLGLLVSGQSSNIPFMQNTHQRAINSIVSQESITQDSIINYQVPEFSKSFKHNINTINSHNKNIKKRSLEDNYDHIVSDKAEQSTYPLSIDNIEDKIFLNIKNKGVIDEELLKSLKLKIKKYSSLKNKNSREGIDILKKQTEILSKINDSNIDVDTKENIQKNIINIIQEIQNEYKSHKVNIEKNIHMIWVAGAPPESIIKYAHAYKNAYPDFSFNLWIDPNAMSAYLFNKEIKEIAFENAKYEVINLLTEEELDILKTTTNLNPEFNKRLEDNFQRHLFRSILQLQDTVINYSYSKGLLTFNDHNRIEFLRDVLRYDEEKILSFKESLKSNQDKVEQIQKKLSNIFGEHNVNIKSVTELPEMKQEHSKHNYQREIILRGNYAAATDQIRIYILKNHGGIYTDYDVTPAYTKNIYQIIQDHSQNYDLLEEEILRRAINDELLSLVSKEPSVGIKNQLSTTDQERLNLIITKIKNEDKIFAPIDTNVIRDSMVMSKRHQWWGDLNGWNERGNNNFLATHKGSQVLDFIISEQERIYRELLNIREQLRTEEAGEQHYYHNPENHKHDQPLRGREKVEAKLFVSGLESDSQKNRKKEKFKKVAKYLKEYGELLKPDTSGPTVKDIRATTDFLQGYSDANASISVDGFKDNMSIKEIVTLMKKNRDKLNNKQIGALSYEVESRALSVTFQPLIEKHHKFFEQIKYNGEFDKYAKEKLMPQLLILNLSGDGFGGRCDPLSILLLAEKYLKSKNTKKESVTLLENLYSTAAVLSDPLLYTSREVENAQIILSSLAKLHTKNPMHTTLNPVWHNKKENIPIKEVINMLSITDTEPVLLKLETLGHAMAAWSVNDGDVRIYGFYDADGGMVEFSDKNKFSDYFLGVFNEEGLNKGKKYKLNKNNNEFAFNRVVSINGEALLSYRTGLKEKSLKEILNIEVFESNKKTIKTSNKKIKFDPNKYRKGSLFSNYRMDGIVPHKYSTLYITGPDAIMRSMKRYYDSLGELGQCRLDASGNQFKGLGDDSFVGNLNEIVSSSGKHYDWINQKSVGINDITPDDDSTWIGKENNIIEIFSNIEDTKYKGGILDITPTRINVEKLIIGWPSNEKEHLKLEWPTIESDYNELINSKHLDINKLSIIDQKIHQHFLSSSNDLVKWAGISLSDQITAVLKKTRLHIGNKAHYFLEDIESSPENYKKSILSILSGDNNTEIIIWSNNIDNENALKNKLNYVPEDRIKVRDFSKDLMKSSLIYSIVDDQYRHDDKNKILEFAILSQESGVIIRNAALAAPSRELIDIILEHTGGNDVDAKQILNHLYNHFFNDNKSKFGISGYEKSLQIIFESILEKLDLNNIGKYFSSIMNLSVSSFGMKFSSVDGSLSSDVIVSGSKSGLNGNHIILHEMDNFLSVVYETKNEINKKLSLESIKSKFEHKYFDFMLQNDSEIIKFLKGVSKKNDISLTEFIRGITGKYGFIECAMHITKNKFPSITSNLLKEIELQKQSIYSISEHALIDPKNLRGLDYANSDGYILNPILAPELHDTSVTAKYQALQWEDFYGRNAKLWYETAKKLDGNNVKFHPQVLLTPQEGRCMGLAELYLLADTLSNYNTLQDNLDFASSLWQSHNDTPNILSESDQKFLIDLSYQVEHAQQHGNSQLLLSSKLNKIRLSDFEINSVVDYLKAKNITKFLITTKYHSIIISKLYEQYRVTDPNFGYVDFDNLEKALHFIEESINISPEVHDLYSGNDINSVIDIHFVMDNNWDSIVSSDVLELTSRNHKSTFEKISDLQKTTIIKDRVLPLVDLYILGVTINGKRIDENNINKVNDASNELKINGHLLYDYINKNHLDRDQVSKIRHLLSSLDYQENTPRISPSEITSGPSVPMSLLVRLEQQRSKLATFLASELKKMSYALTNNGVDINSSNTKVIDLQLNKSVSELNVSLQTPQGKKSVSLDVSVMGLSFKESFDSLQEGLDAMHLDEIMSVLGIIQYARMAAAGEKLTTLDHANHISDLKTLFDSALGLTLIAVGEKSFGTSSSQIKLETIVATKLQQIATKAGGTTGQLLAKAATAIKLPILDTALNLWSLGDAVQTYLSSNENSEERILAGVDIGFATTYTSLALLSVVWPPLALSTLPIYLFQQEVRKISSHLYHINMRRQAWLNVENYLNEASKITILAEPEKKLIDMSHNKILGGVFLDLSVSPHKLDAYRSYNDGKGFGNHAHLTDQEVKDKSGYSIACTDSIDVPEIASFWGEGKVTCNDNVKSDNQLAKGYANRLWPPKFPTIPQGDYNTVILGYSSRIISYTEATLMNDGTYKELARMHHPLINQDKKFTTIKCSDEFTTLVQPPLDHQLFLSKNQDTLHTMKHTWFHLTGGKNGMILHTNGIGNVEFRGKPHTQNILSFKNLGKGFSVHLNLNTNTRQTVVKSSLPYQTAHSSHMMDLIQNNINTIIGSDYGDNTFIGNQYDNHFILGSTGGRIYLGGGNNVVEIPAPTKEAGLFRAHITLSSNSGMQYLKFKGSINDIKHISHNKDIICIFLKDTNTLNPKRVTIQSHTEDGFSEYINRLIFSTEDGLEFKITGNDYTFTLESVNLSSWKSFHKQNILSYELFVKNISTKYARERPCVFFDDFVKIFSSNNNIEYLIKKHGYIFNVPSYQNSIIYGESGGRYVFYVMANVSTTIVLKNSPLKPECLDVSNLLSIPPKKITGIYAKTFGDKLIITINKGKQKKIITLLSANSSTLKNSTSRIKFSSHKYLTLNDIYDLLGTSKGDVLIF